MTLEQSPAAAMRLHAEPPRVTRLSRKVLLGGCAVAALIVATALIYALRARDRSGGGEELYSTSGRQLADGLATLPRDYSGPILGPPLPGDLGRPILAAQAKSQPVPQAVNTAPAVDAAEQRRLAEEEAARLSKVFFQTGPQSGEQALADGAPGGRLSSRSAGEAATPAANDRQRAFLDAAVDHRTVAADRVMPAPSPFVLQAGAVIAAALVTGIRSDLPGQITAQVTEHVYDSPTGAVLLVPQGTRIVGQYENGVGFGQRRVLLVWNRLIFPNGRSIVLERQPGADAQGYAGLEDGVDYHWWDLVKAAGLSTLLGIGAELATDDNDRLIRAIRSGAQDTINQAGQQIIQRQLQVAPTLTVRPGFPIRVIVTRDLVLEPYGN